MPPSSLVGDTPSVMLSTMTAGASIQEYASASGRPVEGIPLSANTWLESLRDLPKLDSPLVVINPVVCTPAQLSTHWWDDLRAREQGCLHGGMVWYSERSINQFKRRQNNWPNTFFPLALPIPTSVGAPEGGAQILQNSAVEYAGSIPGIVHQTWKSSASLTGSLAHSVRRTRDTNPDFAHWFWDDAGCRSLVEAHFDHRILAAYDDLIPGAYKADIWRYCVLHLFGGVYLDVDSPSVLSMAEMLSSTEPLFLVKDVFGPDLQLWNALSGSVPGHPLWARALSVAVRRIEEGTKERLPVESRLPSCLWLTGPACLGAAFSSLALDPRFVRAHVQKTRRELIREVIVDATGKTAVLSGCADKHDAPVGIGAYAEHWETKQWAKSLAN